MNSKLQMKDLINIGIFAAVYIVAMMAVVNITGMIPILYVLAPIIVALICATIYMIFVLRTPKPGAVFIMTVLIAFVYLGASYYASIWAIFIGIITELFLRNGGYRSLKRVKVSYLIYGLTTVGPYWVIVIMKEEYLQRTVDYYGAEYATTLGNLLSPSSLVLQMVITIIAAFVGVTIGERILKKHFRKAGIV